jgi:hypothetical protein
VKFRLLSFAAALCLLIALSAGPGFAQAEEIKTEPELVRQMLQEGWIKVAEGVLQRTEWGPVETFTYGENGLRWTARKLEDRIERLQNEYASNPTEELAGIIESLDRQLIEVDEVMASGAAGAEVVSPDELADCPVSYGATASADPQTGASAPGTKANATAYFHANCGEIGNSFTYAHAEATAGTVSTSISQDDPKDNGSWVDSAASASAPGSLACYSEAYGRAWSTQLTINYEIADANYSCSAASPVTASISGPSDVWLDSIHYCETVTWSASATGGSGAYTYKWYLGTGTIIVGTGRSWSKTYCTTNKRVDLRVVATDTSSPAKTDDATFTTWIHY